MPRLVGVDKSGVNIGTIAPVAGLTLPVGMLPCNGAAISQITYAALFAAICPSLGSPIVNYNTGAPISVTLASHGLVTGQVIRFTSSTFAPLANNTDYFIINTGTNTFQLATTLANAVNNVPINGVSNAATGVPARLFPYNTGGAATATEFQVPDLRGRVAVGDGIGSGLTERAIGLRHGAETHTLSGAESGVPAHNHGYTDPGHGHSLVVYGGGGPSPNTFAQVGFNAGGGFTTNVGGANGSTTNITIDNNTTSSASQAHNNMQPSLVVKYGIAYV